jgi:hypothetical protein
LLHLPLFGNLMGKRAEAESRFSDADGTFSIRSRGFLCLYHLGLLSVLVEKYLAENWISESALLTFRFDHQTLFNHPTQPPSHTEQNASGANPGEKSMVTGSLINAKAQNSVLRSGLIIAPALSITVIQLQACGVVFTHPRSHTRNLPCKLRSSSHRLLSISPYSFPFCNIVFP